MNKHITENIQLYLTLEKPEYVILLSGKWGSGKTHFINDFIGSYKNKFKSEEDIDKQFIKISLFGLKDTDSIDEQIFKNIHPLLGSKTAKLVGNILKGALKFGINLDWNKDGKSDGSISTDLKDFNLLDLFSNKSKKDKEIIFIFDDLERTQISQQEILGYINYLVEQSSFKVILIANEEKLLTKENGKIYRDFKEKVIGKTFEVRHNFDDVLDSFMNDRLIQVLGFDKQIISNVYKNAGYNNLRHIKQSIIDFKYLLEKINEDFLKNHDFLARLTYIFFLLNIEFKHGSLEENAFLDYNSLLSTLYNKKAKEDTEVERIFKKYNMESGFLLDRGTWTKIIYKSHIDNSELNNAIGNLSFFIERKEKARPSWVKLWYYREIEDNEFSDLLIDVTQKFKDCSYETPTILLHVIALLIYFHKENLSELSVDEIKNHIKEKITTFSSSAYWKKNLLTNDIMFNGTDLGYMNDTDPDFIEIFKFVREKNKEFYQTEQEEAYIDRLKIFLNEIKNENRDYILNFLLDNNSFSPVLAGLNPIDFLESLNSTSNKFLTKLFKILSSRYTEQKILNGKTIYYHLLAEHEFWNGLKKELDIYNYSHLRGLLLRQFKENLVDVIVTEMARACHSQN